MKGHRTACTVLALNSGSSSLKFAVIRVGAVEASVLLAGKLEGIGSRGTEMVVKDGSGTELQSERRPVADMTAAMERIQQTLDCHGRLAIDVVGHRVVHGGPRLVEPCVIDGTVLRQLRGAVRFDPLHAPPALKLIESSRKAYAKTPQVACFDTAFHRTLPEVASTLPLPKQLKTIGFRRYGFHGLSCESILAQLPEPIPSRLVIAHLGSGSSITAVRDGQSIDTSMGMTSSGGVLMATRTGDLDPGVLVYLMQQKRYDATAVQQLVNHQSGMLGISSRSKDLRVLHRLAGDGDADSALAIEMFCISVSKQIAAMVTVLRGLDTLVFTGGIGEADAAIRARICHALSWSGVRVDASKNRRGTTDIADRASSCKLMVLPAQEERMMARHCVRLAL